MTETTYRQGCGTHLGMLLHQSAGEQPCGECRQGELLRRIEVEAWPAPVRRRLGPVSPEQAARNLAVLMAAMADHSDDPPPPGPNPRPEGDQNR